MEEFSSTAICHTECVSEVTQHQQRARACYCCRKKPFPSLHQLAILNSQTIFQCLGILAVYGQYAFNFLHIKENYSAYDKRQDVHTYITQETGDLNILQCSLKKSQKCFPVSANCNQALRNMLPESES